MHHIFFTSLVEDLSTREHWNGAHKEELLRSTYIKYETYEDRVYDIIDFYLKKCSKFYLSQIETPNTTNSTFEVYASYDKKFLPILDQFSFPDYIKLIERGPGFSTTKEETPENPFQFRCDFLFTDEFKEKYDKRPVSITRIDADDILSNLIFDQIGANLNSYHDFPYFFMLCKMYRQFDRRTGKYTVPLFHHSPGFATLCYPSFGEKVYNHHHDIASQVQMFPHEVLHARIHVEAEGIHAMQTIGNNVGNYLRDEHSGPALRELQRSEYGGYDEDYDPIKTNEFIDLSGWVPVKGKIQKDWL